MRTIAFVILWTAVAFLSASIVKAHDDALFNGEAWCTILDKTTNPWRLRPIDCDKLKELRRETQKSVWNYSIRKGK